jgi:UDP-N-acetylglucosamine--N-acetylmuramyl-(pentapeptide) pyrophosphoryl-undecaprenol N-acetylglucosamine transferase
MLKNKKIKYFAVASGKLRRYWSWQNFLDLFFIKIAFWQSLFLLVKERPNIIISAGSFVSVPLVWAGWCLRIPVLIHQQDVIPGLANKLMAPFAKKITVTFEKSLSDYGTKAIWLGNMIREELINEQVGKLEALSKLGLARDKSVVLIMGGGTGAMSINKLVEKSVNELSKHAQIVHITGQGKTINVKENRNYHSFEFLDTFGLIKVFAAADIVVSRCGMNVLTELSYLGKPAILIPIPDSHQEANAKVFADLEAAVVVSEKNLDANSFTKIILNLLANKNLQNNFRNNIGKVIKKNANAEIIKIIKELI